MASFTPGFGGSAIGQYGGASGIGMYGGGGAPGGFSAALPWPSSPGNLSNPQQAYEQAYSQALAMNKALNEQISAGFAQTGRQLVRGQRRSLKQVKKLGKAERTDIADAYNAQLGDAAQTLISRGLGNTTVQQSVNRGIEADRAKANVRLTGELAGIRGNLLDRFAQQRMALNQAKLNWMNTTTAAYPDFGAYASLIQQQGVPGAGGLGYTTSGGGMENPFSPAASAERMAAVQNRPMGSALMGNYGAPTTQYWYPDQMPTYQDVYGGMSKLEAYAPAWSDPGDVKWEK